MSQLSLSLDSSLLVRDAQESYLPATADQILEAARYIIDQKAPSACTNEFQRRIEISKAWLSGRLTQ